MYNLSDYVMLTRSAYLLMEKTQLVSYHQISKNYDELYNIDKNIENLFSSIYPGSIVSKYILIKESLEDGRVYLPIYLLQIPSYEDGKTLILPMVLTASGLLGIKTVFAYSDSLEMQSFLFELFPIQGLRDPNGPVEFLEYTRNMDFMLDDLKEKLKFYFGAIGNILDKIDKEFSGISEFNIAPLELDAEKSKYSTYVKKSYVLDTPRENKIESMPIRPEFFMPLAIKEETVNQFGKVETKSKVLSLVHVSKKESGASIIKTTTHPIESFEQLNSLLIDENTDLENTTVNSKVIINIPENCDFVIIDSTLMVYVGDGLLVSVLKSTSNMEDVSCLTMNLNKLVVSEDHEINQVEDSAYIDQNLAESVSTESLWKNAKEIIAKGKEVGMDFKSSMMPYLRKLVGLPKDVVSLVYRFIMKVFNTANKMEQNKAIDYQEKLLNDEISEFSETMERLVSITVIAIGSLMIPTTLIIQVMIFLIGKSVNDNIRIRALERMEHRLEDIIDRLDKKIEFANQDYNKEAVNDLKKQRAMYIFAFERIAAVKKKVYGKDRKKSYFKDYDNYKENGGDI